MTELTKEELTELYLFLEVMIPNYCRQERVPAGMYRICKLVSIYRKIAEELEKDNERLISSGRLA